MPQPNGCPRCGPRLMLWDRHEEITGVDLIEETIGLLGEGYVVDIKGLGGFHLACDAENDDIVAGGTTSFGFSRVRFNSWVLKLWGKGDILY